MAEITAKIRLEFIKDGKGPFFDSHADLAEIDASFAILKLKSGKAIIMGNINDSGGICGCCGLWKEDEEVLSWQAYRIIVS